jgi:hypothetical protein
LNKKRLFVTELKDKKKSIKKKGQRSFTKPPIGTFFKISFFVDPLKIKAFLKSVNFKSESFKSNRPSPHKILFFAKTVTFFSWGNLLIVL